MARKKTETPEMPAVAEPKLKPVRLDLTAEEHKILRVQAALSDMSMAAYARKALVEALKAKGAKP